VKQKLFQDGKNNYIQGKTGVLVIVALSFMYMNNKPCGQSTIKDYANAIRYNC
jgi:hypothetical protein